MVRNSSIAVFVVAVLATLILLPRWLENMNTAGPMVRCDLLSESGCSWETGNGRFSAQLAVGSREAEGWVYHLTLSGPDHQERMMAVLTGASMYMGEYPVPLRHTSEGNWQAEFVAPFCTEEDRMVWKMDLKAGNQPIHDKSLTLLFTAASET